jgi:hypothetical protein
MKFTTPTLAGAAVAGMLIVGGGAVAVAGSNTASTTVYVLGSQTGPRGPIEFAGAIGDYGPGKTVNAAGKTVSMGNLFRATMQKGNVTINLKALNQAFESSAPKAFNASTCSGEFVFTAPITLVSGTGSYKGVSGKLRINVISSFVLPRIKSGASKGQCNMNSEPAHDFTTFAGKGTAKL